VNHWTDLDVDTVLYAHVASITRPLCSTSSGIFAFVHPANPTAALIRVGRSEEV
jgi:hypothetical protein